MIYFLLLITTLLTWAETPLPLNTKTRFDFNGGIQGRTLPGLGAELYGESGYNILAWGKKEEPKDFLYGLIRPNIGVSTSGVINSARAELEVFPISILGFAVGRQIQYSNFEFPFFDCEEVTCKGEYLRNYVETKMVLGYQGWVVLGNYRVDTLRAPNSTMPMVDWRNVIVGEPGEEVEIEKKLMIGKLFSNKLLGVLIENVQFQGSGERKESFAAIYQVRKDLTNYMIGVGGFHTDQQPMGFQFYFRIHHVALPSLKIF